MPVHRTKCLSTRLTKAEYATLETAAGGTRISEWARDTLLTSVTRRPAIEHFLAELLALRTILLNLHFAVAQGEPVTADTLQRLIDRADHEKRQKAQARLADPPRRVS